MSSAGTVEPGVPPSATLETRLAIPAQLARVNSIIGNSEKCSCPPYSAPPGPWGEKPGQPVGTEKIIQGLDSASCG